MNRTNAATGTPNTTLPTTSSELTGWLAVTTPTAPLIIVNASQDDETVGQRLTVETDSLADVEHQCQQDQAEENDDGGVHGVFRPLAMCCLIGRLREQARSHMRSVCPTVLCSTQIQCGSGLAREGVTEVSARANHQSRSARQTRSEPAPKLPALAPRHPRQNRSPTVPAASPGAVR